MANTSNLDDFKETLNEIQENAVDQWSLLPEQKKQQDTLDEEFRAVFKNLKFLRNEALLVNTATEVANVKLHQLEVQERQQSEDVDKLHQECAFYQHLIESEQQEIAAHLVKHEDVLKTLAQTFRLGPLIYEPDTLGCEVAAMKQSALDLDAELQGIQQEVGRMRQQYDEHTAPHSSRRNDMQALNTVLSDSVLVDNVMNTLTKKEEECVKVKESLKQEIRQLQAAVSQQMLEG